MRCKGLLGLLVLPVSVALGLGCGESGGGWQPVAGKDAKAHSLIVPVLHRDETHTVVFKIFNNGSETIPAGFKVTLEGGVMIEVYGTEARMRVIYEQILAPGIEWLEIEGHTDTPDRAQVYALVKRESIISASLVLAY